MASTMVEIMPSSDHTLASVDDNNQLLVDDLCMSVKSISLTESSAVEKTTQQIVNDGHHMVDSLDRDEDKTSGIDKLDGNLSIKPFAVIPVQQQTTQAFVTSSEKIKREEMEDWEISRDSRTGSEGGTDMLAASIEEDKKTVPAKHTQDVLGLPKVQQRMAREHDETGEESDETASEIVARGPVGGIPVQAGYGQPVCQPGCYQMYPQYGGLADYSENAPKYRKPPPKYVPPAVYADPPAITLSPLMNGGNVIVQSSAFQFGANGSFLGGLEPSTLQQPVVTTPVIDQFNLANSEVDKVIDEFLQNQISVSSMPSEDYDAIMKSANDDDVSKNRLVLPVEMPSVLINGISTHPGNEFAGFPAAFAKPRVDASPTYDRYSDCISPGSAWSPGSPAPTYSAMSPASVADSGLEDDLDDAIEILKKHASGELPGTGDPYSVESPIVGNPRHRYPSFGTSNPGNLAPNPAGEVGHQNQTVSGLPTMVQLIPACTVPSVVTSTASHVSQGPVTCIFVPSVVAQPIQAIPRPSRYREIRPRPPDIPQDSHGLPDTTITGMLMNFL